MSGPLPPLPLYAFTLFHVKLHNLAVGLMCLPQFSRWPDVSSPILFLLHTLEV